MATLPYRSAASPRSEERFFLSMTGAMAMVVIAGFSLQWLMGRSSFQSPPRVHLHALAFMGWIVLSLCQAWFASIGATVQHRRLGWFSLAWIAIMIISSAWVVAAMTRNGTVPFFFPPQQLLVGDPMSLIGFAALTMAAIAYRRRTDWHARLHIAAMAILIAPAFGRLLPMALFIPWSLEIAMLLGLIFPIAGLIRDQRRGQPVHPAWLIGIAAVVMVPVATDSIAYSPLGSTLYQAVTAGSPGAALDPLAYPAPIAGPRTGR